MTDNEIIKALERCSTTMAGECKECPLYKQVDNCTSKLTKDALDLINRQKAEIERLQKENNDKFNKWEILDNRTKERYAELYEETKVVVRAEAIKEFVERLKKIMITNSKTEDGYCEYETEDYYIDNLVKEMTEVQE